MKPIVHIGTVNRVLLILNFVIALIYFSWWFLPGNVGNPILYYLLLAGEIYHILLAMMFWFTLWPAQKTVQTVAYSPSNTPSVDIFIPVAGEPVDVVQATVHAVKQLDYPQKSIYILNDGFVAKKPNWKEIEKLAESEHIHCITRKTPGGAKAGNINNALKSTHGEIVTIFDADMKPHSDFLKKVIPYFQNPEIGFVQTPQYYANYQTNEVSAGAWEQQEFFFGPIMAGKEKSNASFICGTNFAIRRKALEAVGGMCEQNIAEDFITSLSVHQKGWKSVYLSEVLSEGLAPEDMLSYWKQQLRWARGSLEVLFAYNPLFKRGLTWSQRIEYLSSALFYFNGPIVLIDIIMPLVFLFTGIQPVASTTTTFALFFVPFMFMNLYTLYLASDQSMTLRAISFSQSLFLLQLLALTSVITGRKMEFTVTSKKAQSGNYISIAMPHIFYGIFVALGTLIALLREGYNPSVITNIAWGVFNMVLFFPFIKATILSSSLKVKVAAGRLPVAAGM